MIQDKTPFTASILTLYPKMFPGVLGFSLAGRALENDLWRLNAINIRDFATDKQHTVDDVTCGGGAGMVMKPDVVGRAIEAAEAQNIGARLVHLTPRGVPFTQKIAEELAQESGIILLCGRFEGIDERVNIHYQPLELSIGDYVLFGGEVAAMVVLEAILRQLPNILGNKDTLEEESFCIGEENTGLLEYSHYTKPPSWQASNGDVLSVPEVLLSGNHAKIKQWRQMEAERITRLRRPDLWERYQQDKIIKGNDNG